MSTDKTLADVQPGGRVRLGDQAELDRHEFQAWTRELLPCPFCGNVAEFVPYKDNGLTLKCKSMGCIQRNQRTLRYGIDWLRTSMAEHWNTRALSAQPSPGKQAAHCPVKHCGMTYARVPADGRCHACGATVQPSPGGQDALATLIDQWMARADRHEASALEADSIGGMQMAVAVHEARAAELNAAVHSLKEALAARQPVGEPVEHACTNCDRTDEVVICQTCAGMAWDNGRLHEFHEVRELSTSLGEGVLDHLLPDEWHEKPLLRFQGAFDEGDRSVGIGERCGNVLAADQSGTVLGDYLAARAAKEGGQ